MKIGTRRESLDLAWMHLKCAILGHDWGEWKNGSHLFLRQPTHESRFCFRCDIDETREIKP